MINNTSQLYFGLCTQRGFYSVFQVNYGYNFHAESSIHHRFFFPFRYLRWYHAVEQPLWFITLRNFFVGFCTQYVLWSVFQVNFGYNNFAESSLDHDFDPSFDVTFDHARNYGMVPLSIAGDFRRALLQQFSHFVSAFDFLILRLVCCIVNINNAFLSTVAGFRPGFFRYFLDYFWKCPVTYMRNSHWLLTCSF